MAAEEPAVEDFSDDLLDSVADEVVGGTTRDQMLGTLVTEGMKRRRRLQQNK